MRGGLFNYLSWFHAWEGKKAHEQKGRQSRFVLDEVEGGEDHGSRIGLTSGRYGKPIAFVSAGEYILGSAGVFL